MLAYGKLSRDLMAGGYSQGRLGFEFSGTLPSASASEAPQRVMGVARQSIATSVGAPKYLVRLEAQSLTLCCGDSGQTPRLTDRVLVCPSSI